jgi:hypothetical protein
MSHTRRHLVLALSIIAAAVLAAGCGDGSLSKNEYVEKNNTIQTDAQKAIGEIGASSDPEKMSEQMTTAKTAITKAAADLEKLDPPSDWQEEHDELVAVLEEMSALMAELETAAEKQDIKALQSASSELNDLQARSSKAIKAMNDDR